MEDEAEIYDGIRAQFPLSFGKQSKSQIPLEVIHSATRRTAAADSTSGSSAGSDNVGASTSWKSNAFPSLSSSSGDWLESFENANPKSAKKQAHENRLIGPSRAPVGSDEDSSKINGLPKPSHGSDGVDEDEEPIMGPPRPTPRSDVLDEDDEPLIGPTRPPSGRDNASDDDGSMIGPPRPPPNELESESEEDLDEEDEDSGLTNSIEQ